MSAHGEWNPVRTQERLFGWASYPACARLFEPSSPDWAAILMAPRTPAGRLELVSSLRARRFITKKQARELLG